MAWCVGCSMFMQRQRTTNALPVVSARVASKTTESMQWTSLGDLFSVSGSEGHTTTLYALTNNKWPPLIERIWWVGFGAGDAGYVAAGVPLAINASPLSNVS